MSTPVMHKLNVARERLEELGQRTAALASAHPDVFDDTGLRQRLEAFESAHAEASDHVSVRVADQAAAGSCSAVLEVGVHAVEADGEVEQVVDDEEEEDDPTDAHGADGVRVIEPLAGLVGFRARLFGPDGEADDRLDVAEERAEEEEAHAPDESSVGLQ